MICNTKFFLPANIKVFTNNIALHDFNYSRPYFVINDVTIKSVTKESKNMIDGSLVFDRLAVSGWFTKRDDLQGTFDWLLEGEYNNGDKFSVQGYPKLSTSFSGKGEEIINFELKSFK